MDDRFSKCAAFFGRDPDFVREPQSGLTPEVSVGRFPPVSVGFFRRFITPAHEFCVYITHGMSNAAMHVPAEPPASQHSRIELCAYTTGAYIGAYDGDELVSRCLQFLSAIPFESDTYLAPLHTASFGRPLCPGSEMSGFFFAIPTGVDMRRLCSCTPQAELVVSVFPISSSEHEYTVKHGGFALMALFEKNQVQVTFDPFRKPVI
jgi:hypothetical protein